MFGAHAGEPGRMMKVSGTANSPYLAGVSEWLVRRTFM